MLDLFTFTFHPSPRLSLPLPPLPPQTSWSSSSSPPASPMHSTTPQIFSFTRQPASSSLSLPLPKRPGHLPHFHQAHPLHHTTTPNQPFPLPPSPSLLLLLNPDPRKSLKPPEKLLNLGGESAHHTQWPASVAPQRVCTIAPRNNQCSSSIIPMPRRLGQELQLVGGPSLRPQTPAPRTRLLTSSQGRLNTNRSIGVQDVTDSRISYSQRLR